MYCFHQKLLSHEIRNFAAHSSREKRTIAAPRGMRLGTKSFLKQPAPPVHAGSANDWWEVAITIASAMATWAVLTVIEPSWVRVLPSNVDAIDPVPTKRRATLRVCEGGLHAGLARRRGDRIRDGTVGEWHKGEVPE
jgi:hypothetical protein